jgi:small subunit ribosomal protein S1
MSLPHVFRITKYDPADRNEWGRYHGSEDVTSDHGVVEAAYLAAMAAFAEDTGVTRLAIREPLLPGIATFGVEAPIEGHGLEGLFPPDLTGFHDGAEVDLTTGLALLRAMLRDNGASCDLEVDERFFVHVGFDQYMYIGSAEPCENAIARTRSLGLFPEPMDSAYYERSLDRPPPPRPADDVFWAELTDLATRRGAVILEEGYVLNASRWHRLRPSDVGTIRTRLTPRSRLWVWPDLDHDVAAVLRELPEDGCLKIVWEHQDGRITSFDADDEHYPELPALLAEARAAMAISMYEKDHNPLLAAVLPDDDGVLRARWEA